MNFLEELGIPLWGQWVIFYSMLIVLFVLGVVMYDKKYSKKCRNCGEQSGKKILCEKCYQNYKECFPHEWENNK